MKNLIIHNKYKAAPYVSSKSQGIKKNKQWKKKKIV